MAKKTKAQMRVEIAEDVIAKIKAKRIIPRHGKYIHLNQDLALYVVYNSELQLKEALARARPCHACALGSCFLSAVDRFNKIKVADIDFGINSIYKETVFNFLSRYFSNQQLAEIEAAFEGWSSAQQKEMGFGVHGYHSHNLHKGKYNYKPFPRIAKLADIRMYMIMKNIIRNNGEFVPKQFIRRIKTKGYYNSIR